MSEKYRRSEWVEVLKGIAIAFLVFGFAIDSTLYAGLAINQDYWLLASRLAHSFSLPLFFFASGIFLSHRLTARPALYVTGILETLAWPYVLWSIILVLAAMPFRLIGLAASAGNPARLLYILWQPIGNLWLLYALLLMYLLVLIVDEVRPAIVLLVTVIVSLLSPELGIDPLDKCIFYLPYFFAGQCTVAYSGELLSISRARLLIYALLLSIVQIAGVILLGTEWGAAQLALGFTGTLLFVAVSLLIGRSVFSRVLQSIGIASLAIYIVHAGFRVAIRETLLLGFDISHAPTHVLLQSLFGIFGALLLWRISYALGMEWIFTLRGQHPRRAPAADPGKNGEKEKGLLPAQNSANALSG